MCPQSEVYKKESCDERARRQSQGRARLYCEDQKIPCVRRAFAVRSPWVKLCHAFAMRSPAMHLNHVPHANAALARVYGMVPDIYAFLRTKIGHGSTSLVQLFLANSRCTICDEHVGTPVRDEAQVWQYWCLGCSLQVLASMDVDH